MEASSMWFRPDLDRLEIGQEDIVHDKFSNKNTKLFLLSWIHDKFWNIRAIRNI